MIKKLRFKFISVAMFSLFLVLAIIMTTINILNYIELVSEADSTLSVLVENRGTFPKIQHPFDREYTDPRHKSPELPYESRYFSVLLGENGEIVSVDTGKIAAIDTDKAIEYAKKVWSIGGEKGFADDYRYVSSKEDVRTRVIFLDCGRPLENFRSTFLICIIVSLLGMFAVLVLVILLSGRIVKPVSESYEKQKQFITDAGHEIKTPITIIDADTMVLEMELGDNEWVQDIRLQARRLATLTNDLIFLSRMEEEQNRTQMIELPFSDIVSETAQSFSLLAKTQNKTFVLDIQPMLSLCGDEKGLRQLISILLDNALKYSTENGYISVMLKKQGRAICLEVSNTAENILRENLEHLFDRFYRVDKSRNSQTGGYGIGLSIAKAVVTTHKGKITASYSDNSLFTISINLPI